MDSNHKIAERKVLENESRRYRLQIGSKAMCADLLRIGVKQRKTKRIRLPKIPDMFALDFVRGYFDGDGHVWTGTMYQLRKTPHVTIQVGFTSSSKEFLLDLHDLLHTKGLVGGGVYCKKDAFCIKYSASDSIRLYTLMYGKLGSSKLFLPRKKRIFERYESRKRAKVLRS